MAVVVEATGTAGEAALSRWRLGHRVFHVYLVVMVTLLGEIEGEEPDSDERIAELLGELAILFDATAATMRYASSFDPELYDTTIRPSMAPPVLKPGFSGSLNIDHKRMMTLLVSVPDTLADRYGDEEGEWPGPIARAWGALLDAEQQARYDHGSVCRRLVTGGPSLLRMHQCRSTARAEAGAKRSRDAP